jgi:hypothetical protein
MNMSASELSAGDVFRINDWQLHVIAVERDVGIAVLTEEFGFLLHFARADVLDVVRTTCEPSAA